MYGFDVRSGLGGVIPPEVIGPFKPIRFTLNRKQAARLVAYYVAPAGLFLARKGWKPAAALQ